MNSKIFLRQADFLLLQRFGAKWPNSIRWWAQFTKRIIVEYQQSARIHLLVDLRALFPTVYQKLLSGNSVIFMTTSSVGESVAQRGKLNEKPSIKKTPKYLKPVDNGRCKFSRRSMWSQRRNEKLQTESSKEGRFEWRRRGPLIMPPFRHHFNLIE